MSMADRFPRLHNRKLPDWVANAIDDGTDRVEAARNSQSQQAERLTGEADD